MENTFGDRRFFCSTEPLSAAVDLPLTGQRQFRPEERFGFNTSTQGLWWRDRLLMLILSLVLVYPLLVLILQIVQWTGASWWFWVWLTIIVYQLLMLLIVPRFIMPLFNTFEPLPEGSLKEKLQEVATRSGVVFKSIQVMDGSKRSRHSNAFLSGLGKFKKIALFDTLIQQLEEDEVKAVVAHEMGHQVKWHIPKQLLWVSVLLLVELYIVSLLIDAPWLIEPFGLSAGIFVHGLLVVSLFGSLMTFWLSPLENRISRRFEYEADRYAGELLGESRSMITALEKLEKSNLSNPAPHPVYSSFYYSHPTVKERVAALENIH